MESKGFIVGAPYAVIGIGGNELVVKNENGDTRDYHCTWFAVCDRDGNVLDRTPKNID